MRSLLSILFAALVLPAVGQAATLTITPDNPFVSPGSQVTLTIVGDSQGASASDFFARLLFDPAVFVGVSSTQSETTSFGGAITWVQGFLSCGVGFCDVFNQIENAPFPVDQLQTGVVVLDVIGDPAGSALSWSLDTAAGTQLSYFGLTNAPGYVFPVPEPATAGLLALGLAGLAARRRGLHR